MKKKLFIIIILLFCLTGCIRNNINMKLETNNSFNISIINGYQTTQENYSISEEEKQKYIDNGFKVEDYNEDSYVGIKISYDADSINNVSSSNVDIVELTDIINHNVSELKLFKKERIVDGTLYTANFTYNLTTDELSSYSSSNVGDVSAYQSMMDLKYSITLPVEVEDCNTEIVDGNTYTWNLVFGELNEIKFSFIIKDSDITKEKTTYEKEKKNKKTNSVKINTSKLTVQELLSSFLGIIVLVAVIILYYSFKKKIIAKFKKKKKKKGYHNEAPESIKEKK